MALIDKITAIANAIRVKTGKTDMLTLDQMPGEIEGIETGGEPATVTIVKSDSRAVNLYYCLDGSTTHALLSVGDNVIENLRIGSLLVFACTWDKYQTTSSSFAFKMTVNGGESLKILSRTFRSTSGSSTTLNYVETHMVLITEPNATITIEI